MSCLLTCEELNGMDIESIIKSLIVIDDNGCMALRSTAEGGGGSYTFPSNSGNTAYISSGGNDGTGVVGNISKPFLTANAAIAALNSANNGTLIILSATSTIQITSYNHASMPNNISVQVLCDVSLYIGGNDSAFGKLGVQTNGEVIIDTRSTFSTNDSLKINCKKLTIPNTSVGSIEYAGCIDCCDLDIAENANINITADVLLWHKSAIVGAVNSFIYNVCPPRVWKASLSQTDASDPVVDFVALNTFAETMSVSRVDLGEYNIISGDSQFDTTKTMVYLGSINYDLVAQCGIIMKGTGTIGAVNIHSFDAFLSASDNIIKQLDITIETYL